MQCEPIIYEESAAWRSVAQANIGRVVGPLFASTDIWEMRAGTIIVQVSGTESPEDAVSLMRTRLHLAQRALPRFVQVASDCHSAKVAERRSLNVVRSTRWRSWEKWLCSDAGIEANFCKALICRNRSIARSRRRNGRWLFSARLLAWRPTSCSSAFPRGLSEIPCVGGHNG